MAPVLRGGWGEAQPREGSCGGRSSCWAPGIQHPQSTLPRASLVLREALCTLETHWLSGLESWWVRGQEEGQCRGKVESGRKHPLDLGKFFLLQETEGSHLGNSRGPAQPPLTQDPGVRREAGHVPSSIPGDITEPIGAQPHAVPWGFRKTRGKKQVFPTQAQPSSRCGAAPPGLRGWLEGSETLKQGLSHGLNVGTQNTPSCLVIPLPTLCPKHSHFRKIYFGTIMGEGRDQRNVNLS